MCVCVCIVDCLPPFVMVVLCASSCCCLWCNTSSTSLYALSSFCFAPSFVGSFVVVVVGGQNGNRHVVSVCGGGKIKIWEIKSPYYVSWRGFPSNLCSRLHTCMLSLSTVGHQSRSCCKALLPLETSAARELKSESIISRSR